MPDYKGGVTMERRVTHVPAKPTLQALKRVAAYARVSSGKDAMLHSLAAQVSYYADLINNNPAWRYAGVYADEAITGTKDQRPEFQRLLSDCKAGKIEISRGKWIQSHFCEHALKPLEIRRSAAVA